MIKKKVMCEENEIDPYFLRVRSEFNISIFIHDRCFEPVARNMEMWAWILPSRPQREQISVLTREPGRNKRVTGKGIRSHALHGVDNTGNVRVWVRQHLRERFDIIMDFVKHRHLNLCYYICYFLRCMKKSWEGRECLNLEEVLLVSVAWVSPEQVYVNPSW